MKTIRHTAEYASGGRSYLVKFISDGTWSKEILEEKACAEFAHLWGCNPVPRKSIKFTEEVI